MKYDGGVCPYQTETWVRYSGKDYCPSVVFITCKHKRCEFFATTTDWKRGICNHPTQPNREVLRGMSSHSGKPYDKLMWDDCFGIDVEDWSINNE